MFKNIYDSMSELTYKYLQGDFWGGVYTPQLKDILDSRLVMSIVGKLTVYLIF